MLRLKYIKMYVPELSMSVVKTQFFYVFQIHTMEKMSGVVLLNSQRIFRHSLLENAQVYTPSLFVFRNYIPGPAKPVITIPVEGK